VDNLQTAPRLTERGRSRRVGLVATVARV